MKIEQNIIFTDEDFELLKKELPNNPCCKCRDSLACCGCSSGDIYNKAIMPYKDNNILEIALKIKEYKQALKSINEQQGKLDVIRGEIPSELLVKLKL